MKRFAFTLAELLITLSIVVVISILTIPTVTTNMSKRSNIVKLQSTIKTLNDAIGNLLIEERVNDIGDSSLVDNRAELFENYLKISSQCDDDPSICFGSDYTSISGTAVDPFTKSDDNDDAMLPNGAAIQITEITPGENAAILIDVNGPKKPNQVGRDLFTVRLFKNGMVGSDSASDDYDTIKNACIKATGLGMYGLSCVYLLETNGWVMDY